VRGAAGEGYGRFGVLQRTGLHEMKQRGIDLYVPDNNLKMRCRRGNERGGSART